jgi:paraquat-inducible protein B
MFVLGALILGLVGLLSFGGVNFFSKPQRFVVYFDESIHGLDLGSPVKLRGVRIGRVVDLNVRYGGEKHKSVVAVTCEFSKNMIMDETGKPIDVSSRAQLQSMIDRGMRARLDIQGLATGLLFVELDFFDPEVYPVKTDTVEVKYAVVPWVPSATSEFQNSLLEILSDLKKVNFAAIGGELRTLLVDTHKQISGLNLAELNAKWSQAGQSVTDLANSPEIRKTIANLNTAIVQLNSTLVKIDGKVDPTAAQLSDTLLQAQATLKNFNSTAITAQTFISAQNGFGDEAARALQQLSEAAQAVQHLADFLERNPNALLTGKKPPR